MLKEARYLQSITNQKKLLATTRAEDLQQRVRNFRRTEIKSLSDEILSQEIFNVVSFSSANGNQETILNIHGKAWPSGTEFFRARGVDDGRTPPKAGMMVRDSEAPDGSFVKRPGRLHRVGEPILYTAIGDPRITLSECRIPIGNHAVIFAYKARRSIRAPVIGAVEINPTYTSEERLKLNIINDFLYDEFSREVEDGLEHLYRPSEIIAKWLFDGPPDLQDCWVYASTKSRQSLNAAFRPNKAHECLHLIGSILVRRTEDNQFECLSVGRPNRKKLEYFPIGSPEQKELFPQITPKAAAF